MKQTNNAIKFLMAQYRAIFKNAYFKGLAAAAVVTMGLAAGQAQAANNLDGLAGTEPLTFSDSAQVQISGSGSQGWNAAVSVTGQNTAGAHSIKADQADLTLSGKGSLTVDTKDATKGISLEAVSAGTLTVDISSINVNSGLLKVVSDASKIATIKADTITLGQSGNEASTISSAEPTAVLDLGTKSVLGKVDANGGSTINIFNGAALKIQDSNAAIADVVVNAKTLNISGGSIILGEGTKTAAAEIKISEGSMTGGSISIAKSGTATISALKPTGHDAPVSFDVTGGNVEVSGTLKVGQDVSMSVGGDAKLYTKTTEAQAGIEIASGGVFKTSKEALLGLTTGKNSAGADYVTGAAANKGGVNIASGGVLYITGENVSLKGLTLASGGALTAKSITSTNKAGESTLKFDSLVVDAKVADSDKFNAQVLGTLTLGSGEYTGGASNKSFNQINAKNLAFNSTDAYDLAEKVVLASADSEGKAAAGTISGNAKLGETLTINQGNYTQDGTLTFTTASKELQVHAANTVDKTSLDFNGTLELDRAKASTKISVSGAGTALDSGVASLDLTDATINFVDASGTNAVNIEALDNATVKVSDQQLKNIFFADGTTNGVVFDVNKGKLLIDGNVELTASQIANNTSTSGIKLQSGSVVVDGELVLRKADVISLGNGTADNAKLKAASLDAFKNTATSTSFKSGTFTFTQGLNTDAANGFILDSGSVMKLGDFVALDKEQTKWKSESETGSITKDLVLKADGVKLDIVAGDWDAQKVTVTSGTLTVGNDGKKTDANGNAIKSSLTTSHLTASTSNAVAVTKQGTLKTTEITVNTGASINVSGDMYIAGKHEDAVTSGENQHPEQFGIKLANDAISLKAGSTLTLGEQANYALGLADASGKVESVTVNNTVFDAAGSLTGEEFSTVKLSLADGVELTAKALKELKAGLFGNESTVSTIDIGAAKISGLDIKTDAEGNKTLDWSAVDADIKNVLPTYKDAELAQTTILIDSGEDVFGHVGAVKATGVSKNGSVTVSNHGSLNSADNVGGKNLFAYNEKNEAVGLSVAANVNFALVNGGEAGKVSLGENSALLVDGGAAKGKTVLAALDGKATSELTVAGDLNVTGDATLGKATSKEGTSFTVGGNAKIADVAVLAGSTSVKGNLSTTNNFTSTGNLQVSGASTFAGETKLSGNNTLLGDVAFNGKTTLEGQNTLGATTFQVSSSVAQGQTFAKEIKLNANTVELSVGQDEVKNTLPNGSTANLVADKLTLAGGTLYADPTFNLPRTIVVAGELTQLDPADKDTDAGTLDGKAVALRNSIIALGVDTKDANGKDAYQAAVDYVENTFAPLFEADQSLQSDGIGAIAYVNKKLTMGTGKIVVDPTNGIDGYKKAYSDANSTAYKDKIDGNEIYLGTGAALAVDANALNNGAAISFNKATDASVYAEQNAKVLVVGNGIQNKNLVLFENTNAAQNAGVILNGNDLAVESINGLFKGKFTVGQSMEGEVELSLDRVAANKYLSSVSAPVQDTLLAAAYGMHNYEEYEAAKKDGTLAKFQEDSVLGDVAEGFKVVKDKNTQNYVFYYGEQVATPEQLKEFNIDKDTSIELAKKNADVKEHVVYVNTKNDLLDNILYYDGNAIDAETNARLAVFGGAPQAAIEAGASTYEAISARMGVGVSGVSAAANGQGGAIWVTPVYKSADADGFNADNKSYGADVKLYGLALGADIEVAPNFKVGGMFNVGSGDADGQGLGANVSNDFDYYGLGLYAGYSMDAFSLVADVTYTAVDNDIEGNTDLGKVNASIDSTNLSVGVTGQYKLSLAGMDVTPHAGLRYSMIDMDDYSTAYSQNDSDSLNIFSVPVGVTIAKEYVTDTWTVKPSFDLTLTGNFGDDEVDATAKWNGFSNLSTTVKSEIMDNFTYGAAVGVSATSGNFGLGLGVNYTGSSNTDEFGVNANARYMF